MGRQVKRIAVAGMVAAAMVGSGAGTGPDTEGAGVAVAAQTSITADMAQAWLPFQQAGGGFDAESAYGDAMLGYGLLDVGLREGDAAMQHAGLRALAAASTRVVQRGSPSAFENLALAAAYNLARTQLGSDRTFVAVRPVWEQALRRITQRWSTSGRRYFNKYLVEAVATLELTRTGLRSREDGAVLRHPARARAHAVRFVNAQLASQHSIFRATAVRGHASLVLSDPPWNPLAYHGLSLGMLARAIEILGPEASRHAHTTLRRAAYASWTLMAPDGDLAYYGRSQEQAWVLGLTAYGAETASKFAPRPDAARLIAVARRAMQRLARSHPIGRRGLPITPAVAASPVDGRRGMDAYANPYGYAGLSLVAANWALGAQRSDPPAAIAADRDAALTVGSGQSRLAVVRRGRIWFAVKQSRSAVTDLRYDFGLVAMKVAGPTGWQDVVPIRPNVHTRNATVGPILQRGGAVGFPVGERMLVGRSGWVTVVGGYRTARGDLLRTATFRFRATGDCVAFSFRLRRGERVRYASFLTRLQTRSPRGFSGGSARISVRPAARRTTVARGFASGSDARLVRVDTTLQGPAVAQIKTCPEL